MPFSYTHTHTVLINEEVPDAEVEKTVPTTTTTTTILPSSSTLTALPTIVVPQVKQGNALLINELKKRVKDEVLAPQDKHSEDENVKGIKNSVTESTEDMKINDTLPNQDLATKSEQKVAPNSSILATTSEDDDDANSTKEAFYEIADLKDKSDIKFQNGVDHQQLMEETPKKR